ncbi:MAG TPA: CHAT domain-containing protein, partial [Vicinamibacterales bacterium]
IPGARIGCFGPGGNITAAAGAQVNHINFFGQPGTVEFLANALAGKPQGRPSINPSAPLPNRNLARRSATAPTAGVVDEPSTTDLDTTQPRAATTSVSVALEDDTDTFHIVVMDDFDTLTGKRNAPDRKRNFAQVYATYGGARVTVPMRLRKSESDKTSRTDFGKIIGTHERIRDYTNFERGSLPSDAELKVFGSQLFNTLFQGDVRRLYDEARSRQRGRRLDLVLTSMVPWIGEKPWEFAYDDSRNAFLATEEIHFVRNVLTSIPADAITPVNGPLRILVAAAQPVAFDRLSIDEEVAVIRRGFDALVENNLVTIDVLAGATPAALHGYLSTGRYNIVHFIGHGEFDMVKNEGCLIFQDSRGGSYPVGERSLREIFCQRGLSLVFLNACQSGTGGRADFNKGVAQAMVSHGLPALVANQYSVLDSSATSFAQHFYFSLAQGMSLGQAAREARIAVNYALQGDPIDWAVPVLYARDANRTLCAKPAAPIRVPAVAVKATSRRAVKKHQLKIAVWDVDEVFPELEKTLQQMNAAQDVYGFQETRLSLPLDVWDLESVPGTPYLDASKLAARLSSKPGELHVDLLLCVTRHWMGDAEWLNLPGWWPYEQSPKVAVVSCAGFDELEPKGPQTDRVIANTVVSILAGFFGSLDTHAGGKQNCPLAFNQSRAWQHIAGQLEFDARCRAKVRGLQRGAVQLRALETLLKLFKG